MSVIACANLRADECLVASKLAGLPVIFDKRACQVCVTEAPPQTVNKVTTDIAAHSLRLAGKLHDATRVTNAWYRRVTVPTSQTVGVGTVLMTILPWVDATNPGCDCASYIHLMNQWGPEKCIEKRGSLVRWFGKVAQTLGVAATTEELELAIFRAADECRARVRDDAAVGQWPFVWTYWAGGAVGDELRYSIRSVLHHHPQARVIVVGDKPLEIDGDLDAFFAAGPEDVCSHCPTTPQIVTKPDPRTSKLPVLSSR